MHSKQNIYLLFITLVFGTYLLLLFIEVINDDSNEKIESEEGSKDDEEHKVDVHPDVTFSYWLLSDLKHKLKIKYFQLNCHICWDFKESINLFTIFKKLKM